jgi:hypothetical protein
VGFGEAEITPEIGGKKEVWLAGYGMNRAATGVHDPLMARCVVLQDGGQKIALVSVDLVGLQYPAVLEIRKELPGFAYVMVSSTHNHEGPDVIGMWGKSPLHYGVDDDYVAATVKRVAQLVKDTAGRLVTDVEAEFGMAEDASLLKDSRLPTVYDAVLRALVFTRKESGERAGILVQWNSHPESLGSKNTEITADFPWATVEALKGRYQCPVAYFTGAVGGLMAPPAGPATFEYAEKHGKEVAALAGQAIESAQAISLTPMTVKARTVYVPVSNKLYRIAKTMGVLRREGFVWTCNAYERGEVMSKKNAAQTMAIESEVSCLSLGDLRVAGIPGELYPELVYGKFQDPVDPAADFPEAELEPTITGVLGERKWMLFGLANDEVGYLIPKRQWDSKKPFAYGRKVSQYGEVNSCGPDAAGVVMEGFRRCVEGE